MVTANILQYNGKLQYLDKLSIFKIIPLSNINAFLSTSACDTKNIRHTYISKTWWFYCDLYRFIWLGNCGICNKLVTDEGCTAFGKFYHKECFKCCVCKQKISGKFFERGGKPYCARDFAVSLIFWTIYKLSSFWNSRYATPK